MNNRNILFCFFVLLAANVYAQNSSSVYHEQYRPQIHFSPQAHWMNDPNGMVYNNGIYHLFFQYYPGGSVWGPMHWGHATSADLIHWQQQPVALYPDSIGYIFSGSAVTDSNNTSGFGINGKAPLVAVFTQHDTVGEKAKNNIFQNQSIAYSNDDGKTWATYAHNPVLKNPGIADFRDPKVMWYEPGKKWMMTLAVKDHINFYSSPDLKSWTKESEFGKDAGAHGGVWECPDLFWLDDNGKKLWVLIVSVGSGAPNAGSGTQYFIGDFNGNTFTAIDNKTRWMDYGADDYAGVTWSGTTNRKIFLGWMSNWLYAQKVPTLTWRSAMTLPRELRIQHTGNDIFIAAEPVKELKKIESKPVVFADEKVDKKFDVTAKMQEIKFPCRLNLSFEKPEDFSLVLSNNLDEKLIIGFDKRQNQYFIDRTKSGTTSFQKDFASKHIAPRLTGNNAMKISLFIDVGSVELFADNGETTMTDLFFPSTPYNHVIIQSPENITIKNLEYFQLSSIWK